MALGTFRPTQAQRLEPYRWLLTLRIGSRVVRLSTGAPVTVTGNDGDTYVFDGGLPESNYEQTLDLMASPVSPRSRSFTTTPSYDLAQDVARGVPLYAGTGELAQWYEGTTWEQRRPVLTGAIQEPVYGEAGESFSFALVEDPADDTSSIPSPALIVEVGVTFSESATLGPDPGIVGVYYPIIVGAPGAAVGVGTSSVELVSQVPAAPALLVQRHNAGTTLANHWIMVCAGWAPATAVKVYNATTPTKTFTATALVQATDLLGQQYTYVIPTTGNTPTEGDALYSVWAPTSGGGTRNQSGLGTLRGAGDVIRWALTQSSVRYDTGRLGELSALNSYKIDTYINTPTSAWAWLQANVLPLLPVTVSTGPGGLAIVPRLSRLSNPIHHLEDGRDCARASGAVYTPSQDVYNAITINYAPNAETGGMALHNTLDGNGRDPSDTTVTGSYWCQRSQTVFGRRVLELDAAVVYDPATAGAVLRDRARWHSHPRREIIYSAGRELDWLRPGDDITLTDSSLHLSRVPGIVGTIGYGADSLAIQVVLLEPEVFGQ